MANYYSLIADAVAEKRDEESRLSIYDRAHAGLRQLYKLGRLTSAELAHERAALDAAIRKFEADARSGQGDLVRLKSILAEVTQGQAPGPNSGTSDAMEANNAEALEDVEPQDANQSEPVTRSGCDPAVRRRPNQRFEQCKCVRRASNRDRCCQC